MNLNKKILLSFILIFSNIPFINTFPNNKNQANNIPNDPSEDNKKESNNKNKGEIIEVLNELIERNNKITEECNNLKIKKEVYNIYLFLLLSANILFILILFFYLIYILYYYLKEKKIKNIVSEQKEYDDIEENQINKNLIKNNKKSLLEETFNQKRIDAPVVEKYVNTPRIMN